MLCCSNHIVATCSAACRELSGDFDSGLCHTKLELRLRQTHFQDIKPRSMTDRKSQCLRDLIFLRHITMAVNLGENPLQTNDIMFANSGPNTQSLETRAVAPWSFVSHVVRPLSFIHQLFFNLNADQFLNLSQVDGWIITSLLSKIDKAIRISKGPRYVKCFRADGMLDTAFGPWDMRWEPPKDQEDEDNATWVAGIDSLFNMIRIADPTKGEISNVALVQKEGVNVFAVKDIKKGEPLLRAAEGTQGPMVDVWALKGMFDGEEVQEGDESVVMEAFDAEEGVRVALDGFGDEGMEGGMSEGGMDEGLEGVMEDVDEEMHSGDTSEFLEESDVEDGEIFDEDEDMEEGGVQLGGRD